MHTWTRSVALLAAFPLGVLLLGIAECSTEPASPTPSKLSWYYSCGDPVCSGYSPDPSMPVCTTEAAGDPCSTEGDACAVKGDDCNRLLVCAASDPTQQPGGCPISQKALKRDIQYLDAAGLQKYRDELMQVKLATWQYKTAPASTPARLGFLIDDQPLSPSVLPNQKQVDVYGYASMTVAAVQSQEQELKSLRQEVALLRQELESFRASAPGCKTQGEKAQGETTQGKTIQTTQRR